LGQGCQNNDASPQFERESWCVVFSHVAHTTV
jgi:hypothetical protein